MRTRSPRLRSFALVMLGAVLQIAIGSDWQIGVARPHLGLIALVVTSLYSGPTLGAGLGFFLGLVEGSFAAGLVGSYVVTRTLAGYAAGIIEERVFRDSVVVSACVTFAATLGVETLMYVFAPQLPIQRHASQTLASAALDAALSVPVYVLLRPLLRSREMA